VIHPRAFAVQGTEATSKLFGDVESVPTYFLYDRNGKLVWQLGGAAAEQSQYRIDTGMLDKVIAP